MPDFPSCLLVPHILNFSCIILLKLTFMVASLLHLLSYRNNVHPLGFSTISISQVSYLNDHSISYFCLYSLNSYIIFCAIYLVLYLQAIFNYYLSLLLLLLLFLVYALFSQLNFKYLENRDFLCILCDLLVPIIVQRTI